MKKEILGVIFILILLVSLSLVFAAQGDSNQAQTKAQSKIKTGNYTGENGQLFRIQEKFQNKYQIKVKNSTAECECNLTQEQVQNKTKLKVHLSNGRNAEIKVMPDTASETALARLRLKVCSEENNCSVILKEVGKRNQTQLAYELRARQRFKILGFIKARAQVQTQVNAENGEVIKVKKPWWAFLASNDEEE